MAAGLSLGLIATLSVLPPGTLGGPLSNVLGDDGDVRAVRALGGEGSPINDAYVSTYEIVKTFPHEEKAFTQGLVFDQDGTLYASDGLTGKSCVRSVDVINGQTMKRTPIGNHFAEGIAVVDGKLVQLTWQDGIIHEYRLPGLEHIRSQKRKDSGKEGWGLALSSDGSRLYLTDSTEMLIHLNSSTYEELEAMPIMDDRLAGEGNGLKEGGAHGRRPAMVSKKSTWSGVHPADGPLPIFGVNELEMVDGELWGNIYPMYHGKSSECLVRINPATGKVIGWVDLTGLLSEQREEVKRNSHNFVLNGIAYHAPSGRLYVTGKQWDKMYQIRIKPTNLQEDHVLTKCGLGGLKAAQRARATG